MLVCLFSTPLFPADGNLSRARLKLDALEARRIQPGFRVTFTEAEVNAWAADQAARKYGGITGTRIALGAGTVSASAMMDFIRLRRAEGIETIPALAQLLEGKRPARLDLSVQSSGGYATVSPTRLEISGVALTGGALDFLIGKFVLPLFPDTEVNRPFELREGIERIEVVPGALRVVMKR
ncbi:MAG: hypothetical protein ABL995_13325 [Bryobacteraceae bacterium]